MKMKKKILRTRVSYEPNRLAEKYLSEVYQQFVPIAKHRIDIEEKENTKNEIKEFKRNLK
jgi:hypothetical protein